MTIESASRGGFRTPGRNLLRFPGHHGTKCGMGMSVNAEIQIAAALIEDGAGRVLLVRKAGTESFMQAGGKIEPAEDPLGALRRELAEEIGLVVMGDEPRYLGRFSAPAANEAGHTVIAELFHIRIAHEPIVSSEIAEALWVTVNDALHMQLAPLTRNSVLPLVAGILTRYPPSEASSPLV